MRGITDTKIHTHTAPYFQASHDLLVPGDVGELRVGQAL
jgi:hypothetical protein